MVYSFNLLIAWKKFFQLLWLIWESLLQFFIKLITSFSYLQLVNESCAMHTAMVFMAWKLVWHTYKCSWSCDALMGINKPSTAMINRGIPAVWLKSTIVACRTRKKYSMSPIPYARRKNSPLPLKFQKVIYIVTVFVSGFTHLIPKLN